MTGKTPRQIVQHLARRLADRVDAASLDFPLLPRDIADSQDPTMVQRGEPRRLTAGAEPRVGWLVVPPGAGSGGHTTLFRMMAAARSRGLRNTLLFYDRHNGDHERNVRVVRESWPWLECDIEGVGSDLSGFDAVVASSWQTAHVAARRRVPGQAVLYFAQDFEPYFSPRGSEYALAEDSYRLGLSTVALGEMVAGRLRDELGVDAHTVPFGCDTAVYHPLPSAEPRAGVIFYAKQGNDRRGFRLAVLALEHFHRLHPDEPIHVYGDTPAALPFPVTMHGSLRPDELNRLYNRVVAGIALSFTNISLVAEEMLAAGVVPVVNDSPLSRADLTNEYAAWSPATPMAIAGALSETVSRRSRDDHARAVAASVTTGSWEETGGSLADIIRTEIPGTAIHGAVPSLAGGSRT
ncbi:glycosyltransferase family 1 protein [Microbacterium sp. P04]|uniref:rhamnosyltransferase WsaF family glycosyltransferase n=1 Tax=Microbacterium sp. P04 TaxID=3366947 RepID=UPI003745D62E